MGWNLNYYSFELKDFLAIDSKEKAIGFLEKNKRSMTKKKHICYVVGMSQDTNRQSKFLEMWKKATIA